MRTLNLHTIAKRLRSREMRGAALVEFALCLPFLIVILAIVFDAGIGFTEARTSSSAARSAARIGALAGDQRLADFRILDALRAQLDPATVQKVIVYRSPDSNVDGLPPTTCTDPLAVLVCNEYDGTDLATLDQSRFNGYEDLGGPNETCDPNSDDANWCPLSRDEDFDDYLGVYVEATSRPKLGLVSTSEITLKDRAVFAFYFEPTPIPIATPSN